MLPVLAGAANPAKPSPTVAFSANLAQLASPEYLDSRLDVVQDVALSASDGLLTLAWTPVSGATHYKVYSSANPYSGFTVDTSGAFIGNVWQAPLSHQTRFYYVTSVQETITSEIIMVEGGSYYNGVANVTVSSFFLDKYELTQAGFEAVMGYNPTNNYGVGPNNPVHQISWYQAVEYCNRRSLLEGLEPCYSYSSYGTNILDWPAGWNSSDANHLNLSCNWYADGYRLPTEGEWEFAARGGTLGQGYTYSGSNNPFDVAWSYDFGLTSHPVGTKAPNELGIYDMSGNVKEYTWDNWRSLYEGDWYNPHGPVEPIDGIHRTQRGGSFGNWSESCAVTRRESASPTYNGADQGFRVCRSQGGLVRVSGGTFFNGYCSITLTSFWLGKTEVTQGDYQSVMGANPASGYGIGGNYPVYNVSWFDAVEYCNRLSLREGLVPCYHYAGEGSDPDDWPAGWNSSAANRAQIKGNWSANGYRLPTEMEWMYAAKGGDQSQGYTFSGGQDMGVLGWYSANSGGSSHLVAQKTANELGFFDMSGNVYELVWDYYADYPSTAQTDPLGPESGVNVVTRGGGWASATMLCTVASRGNAAANLTLNNIGFRVCRRVENPVRFVWVDGGSFNNGFGDVTVNSFWLDKYELTQAEFESVMGFNPASSHGIGPKLAAYYISWNYAIEYCNRRSLQEGFNPCYSYGLLGSDPDTWPAGWQTNGEAHLNFLCNWSANGYRLPSEAEWEFAARGGNQNHGYSYSGSNNGASVAWYWGPSDNHAQPVGLKLANELGFYDMCGNVAEWVWDRYGELPTNPTVNPHGFASYTIHRVNRGGHFSSYWDQCYVNRRDASGTQYQNNSTGFRLCRTPEHFTLVQGGTYNNGSSAVTLSPFVIDNYETTRADYIFYTASVHGTSGAGSADDYPIVNVNWADAIVYCNLRSVAEGRTPCYSYGSYGSNPNDWPNSWGTLAFGDLNPVQCDLNATGYRLPTEAEWEFAARGGNLSQGYTYSGGNNVDAVAWYAGNSGAVGHPVGFKAPNELELFDLSGNANEWCWDFYGAYPAGPQTNPTGPATGLFNKVYRGGCYSSPAPDCATSQRLWWSNQVSETNYTMGFRVCRKPW